MWLNYLSRLGVRELRQNASKYLRRVAAGESFTVTDRGRPVAELVPAQRRQSRYEELVARGELLPPEHPTGALLDPPLPITAGFSASEELQRMRDEERY